MNREEMKNFLENCPSYKRHYYMPPAHSNENFILSNYPNIELYCLTCEKEKTFSPSEYAKFSSSINFISLRYRCAQCSMPYFFSVFIDKKYLVKIGQYPSFAELSHKNIEKYKNVLSKYYIEYKQSLSAYSQGMGVASFVYSRRILEDLVEKKYSKLPEKESKAKFIDKLKAVQKHEDIIPPEIETIKNALYTVLSKGVHEYKEDECLQMYDAVNFVIELILDRELEAKKRSEKIKSVSSIIQDKASNKNTDEDKE